MLRRSGRSWAGWVRRAVIVAAFGVIALSPVVAGAQANSATLSLSTQTVTIPAPAAAEYNAGYTGLGSLVYTVTTTYTTNTVVHITVRATPNGPEVEWASATGGPWTTLAGGQMTVRTETIGPVLAGFTGTIYFRIPLTWTMDPPGIQTLGPIDVRIKP